MEELETCVDCGEEMECYNGACASDGTFYCNACLNDLIDIQKEQYED